MYVIMCTLMSPATSGNAAGIDNHVKIFLRSCNQYSREMYGTSPEPFWHRTGNFPILLCLPALIKKYGPVSWYWEGTSKRHIQNVKKFSTAYRRTTSYFQTKMELMHKTYTCEWIEEELMSDGENGTKKRDPEPITNTPKQTN